MSAVRWQVTGFGAFGAVEDNPSAHLAAAMGHPFQILEVAYAAVDSFIDGLDPDSFDVLLMLGVAQNRHHLEFELYGRNHCGETHDVRGCTPPAIIEPEADLLLQSTLWTPDLVAKLVVSDHLRTSIDAGSYLCNYILYRVLLRFPDRRVGFLHVPPFERIEQATQAQVLSDVISEVENSWPLTP